MRRRRRQQQQQQQQQQQHQQQQQQRFMVENYIDSNVNSVNNIIVRNLQQRQ